MSEEEIKTLEEQWGDTDNLLNDLICDYKELQQENKQLTSILTELEEWIKNDEEKFETTYYMGRAVNMFDLLNKIQELKEKYK